MIWSSHRQTIDKIPKSYIKRRQLSGIRIALRIMMIVLGCVLLIAAGFVAAAVAMGLI